MCDEQFIIIYKDGRLAVAGPYRFYDKKKKHNKKKERKNDYYKISRYDFSLP